MVEEGQVYPKPHPSTSDLIMRNKKQIFSQKLNLSGMEIGSDYETTPMSNKSFDEDKFASELIENEAGTDRDSQSRMMLSASSLSSSSSTTTKQRSQNSTSRSFQMPEMQELINSTSALKAPSTPFNGANFSLHELQQEFAPFISPQSLRYPSLPPALLNPLYLSQMSQSWENYNMPRNFSIASKTNALDEDNRKTATKNKKQSNNSEDGGTLPEGGERKQKEPSQLTILSEEASKKKPEDIEGDTTEDVLPNQN